MIQRWVIRLILFVSVFSLLMSCGGFRSVKKLKKIEAPIELEPSLKTREKARETRKTSRKRWNAFRTKQALKRKKYFSSISTFRVGERTTLALTWFAVKAGSITLEVHPFTTVSGRQAYHFVGRAESSAVMDFIHSVDDWIESYVDRQTFYPFRSAIHGVETDRLREVRVLFDYSNLKINYWMKRLHVRKGIRERRRTDNFKPGIMDLYTAAFYLRAHELEVGKTYYSDLYNEGKHIDVKAEVLRKEVIDTALGKIRALVIRPEARFEGILKTSGDSTVWLTDDDRRFILQLETKIKIGYLKGHVLSIEDPVYTFPSRIEE